MDTWKLISADKARALAIHAMAGLPRAIEKVGLRQALGRICCKEIRNREDNPAFDRSTVDGYAVRSKDVWGATDKSPVCLVQISESRMGRELKQAIGAGQCVRVPTGGMLPQGADAVVMQEDADSVGLIDIEIRRTVKPLENVICRGDDVLAGSVIVPAGRRIGAPDLGVLASCGYSRLDVVKKPRVTVITTGDEIVAPQTRIKPGQIRDVNSYTLAALAEKTGCKVANIVRVPDNLAALTATIQKFLEESDLILISGGSSVGERDYTTQAVLQLAGVKLLFHGIALKPGKPTLMAMCGKTAIFGIPGNTVAAMTIYAEIIEPAIAVRMGMTLTEGRFWMKARLGSVLQPDSQRDEIVRVRLENCCGELIAWPLPAKSGLITVMSRAHGMIYLKAGQVLLEPGEEVEVQLLMDRIEGSWEGMVGCKTAVT